jgi:hypothetical protein
MKVAVEHHFTGTTAPTSGTYDSTKTMISSLLRQATGATAEDKFISTKPSAMINIPEVAIGAQTMPHVYKWSSNIYWIFTTSVAGASATRTIALFEFNSDTSSISYKGYITLSGTTITSVKFPRGLRALVYKHTTGTVSGSSTTITGSGTGFQSERIAVGARIGFGTTDPTAVTTWYDITAISSDTSLTINGSVSIPAGTSYVIEEIRIAFANSGSGTSSIIINNGVHLIKGLNYSTFVSGGTTISEATTVDNIRASYLLKDAVFNGAATSTFTVTIASPAVFTINNHGLQNGDALVFTTTGALPTGLTASPSTSATVYYVINAGTNTFSVSTTLNGTAVNTTGTQSGTHTAHHYPSMNASGIAQENPVSNTEHYLYLVGGIGTNTSVVKYNIRAALTVGSYAAITAGVSSSAYVLKTATVATATPSNTNSARIFTVNHGSASGVNSLYYSTTTRVYRAPISAIASGSLSYLGDAGMFEVPPGGSTTYSSAASFAAVDYSSTIDRIFIPNSAGRFGTYVTKYNASGDQFEKLIGVNLSRLKLTTTESGASDGLFPQAVLTLWTEDGWMFAIPSTTTTGQNWLYVWPFGADAYYVNENNQYVITPKLATTGATKLYSVYVDHQEYAGDYGLGFPVESYKVWYRTSGIDDNSGAWNAVPVGADLQSVSPGSYIQFKIAFDIMGEICVPTRIYSIALVYEDGSQDSHYQPSLSKSSAASSRFAWKQVSSWGGTIPNLRIRLYNADTEYLVLDDNVTSSAYGTFEYSTNGTSWNAWSSSADTIGNYIRYTATTLPNNITVRALLTTAT